MIIDGEDLRIVDEAGVISGSKELPAAGTISASSGCDIDGDGKFDIADVQLLINEVLGILPPIHGRNPGMVDIADVQIVINAVLGLGCNREPIQTFKKGVTTISRIVLVLLGLAVFTAGCCSRRLSSAGLALVSMNCGSRWSCSSNTCTYQQRAIGRCQ